MPSKRYSIADVRASISRSTSWRQVCSDVGLLYAGGNLGTLKRLAEANTIDYSHFLGRGWNIGGESTNRTPNDKLFTRNSAYPSSKVKHRLIKDKLIVVRCSVCNLGEEWQGQKIVLELDHVDGDPTNNLRRNLRLLCPNCHSQTPTFRGRKLKNKDPVKRVAYKEASRAPRRKKAAALRRRKVKNRPSL